MDNGYPSGWTLCTLGQLLDDNVIALKNGFPQGTHNSSGTGVPHLRPFNVSVSGAVDLSQIKYVASPDPTGPYWLRPNDVLFNNTNSEELVGKTAHFEHDGRFVLSNHMTIVRVTDPHVIDSFWLAKSFHYLWQRRVFFALCRRHVNQASVGIERLKSIELALPPLPEQRAIAHVLRTVQRAKEATEQTIAAARELKKSLMKHLFTYGPVPFQEADQVSVRETDYGPVPEAWSSQPLSQCATVQTGVAKGRKLNDDDAITLPYLRVANVQDGYLDLTEMKTLTIRKRETDRYSLQPGDVVLTEGGDFDKLGRGFIWNGEVPNCIHQNHIFAVRANRDLLIPSFLAYLTQSSYGKAYFLSVAHKTTNLACINTTKLKALPTLLPSISEQQDIVGQLSRLDAKTQAESNRDNVLATLFDSLLHNLMTGELRVHDIHAPALEETVPCP